MSGVFLDSSGLIALWNRRDQWHAEATRAFAGIEPGATLVSTSYVLAECANAFSRSELRRLLVALGDRLDADQMLVFPSDADWHEAWTRFSREHSGSACLTDQLSFTVMRRLGLRQAFTNDGHFAGAGFEALF